MDIYELKEMDKIIHAKSGRIYEWLGCVRAKVDGEWIDMASYQDAYGEIYVRMIYDFGGFRRYI